MDKKEDKGIGSIVGEWLYDNTFGPALDGAFDSYNGNNSNADKYRYSESGQSWYELGSSNGYEYEKEASDYRKEDLTTALKTDLNNIGDKLEDGVNDVKQFAKYSSETIENGVENFKDNWKTGAGMIEKGAENFKDNWKTGVGMIGSGVSKTVTNIGSGIDKVVNIVMPTTETVIPTSIKNTSGSLNRYTGGGMNVSGLTRSNAASANNNYNSATASRSNTSINTGSPNSTVSSGNYSSTTASRSNTSINTGSPNSTVSSGNYGSFNYRTYSNSSR